MASPGACARWFRPHAVLAFEMADDGLDRSTTSHLPLDLGCHAPLLVGDVDPEPVIGRRAVATMSGSTRMRWSLLPINASKARITSANVCPVIRVAW
jgi:hypothetical protein